MEHNFEVFKRQYPVVVFFVQHLAYHRGLKAAWDSLTNHQEFWASTIDGHLKLATVAWCNVFGSHTGNMHWRKTLTDNTVEQASQDFRCRVLSRTSLAQEKWEIYHRGMLDFRNKFVAHVDLCKPFDGPVPDFEPALQVAYAYQEWARELIKPVQLNQLTLSLQYEQCKAEASAIRDPAFASLKGARAC